MAKENDAKPGIRFVKTGFRFVETETSFAKTKTRKCFPCCRLPMTSPRFDKVNSRFGKPASRHVKTTSRLHEASSRFDKTGSLFSIVTTRNRLSCSRFWKTSTRSTILSLRFVKTGSRIRLSATSLVKTGTRFTDPGSSFDETETNFREMETRFCSFVPGESSRSLLLSTAAEISVEAGGTSDRHSHFDAVVLFHFERFDSRFQRTEKLRIILSARRQFIQRDQFVLAGRDASHIEIPGTVGKDQAKQLATMAQCFRGRSKPASADHCCPNPVSEY